MLLMIQVECVSCDAEDQNGDKTTATTIRAVFRLGAGGTEGTAGQVGGGIAFPHWGQYRVPIGTSV